jgi:pseudouridine-5'-phosphate glycosidase
MPPVANTAIPAAAASASAPETVVAPSAQRCASATGTSRSAAFRAGAKAFLDLPRTLEHLETAGVPVLGWRHDWFPAFYTRSSGLRVPHRVESAGDVAAVLANRSRAAGGVLLAVPIPEPGELDPAELDTVVTAALADADAAGVTGAAVTPFVLGRIADATAGRSVPANLALAEHNAAVAAEVAIAVATS